MIGAVLEDGYEIDDSFSCLFFMRAKLKKERETHDKYHRQVIEYEMNEKWSQLIRKLIPIPLSNINLMQREHC